MSIAHEVSTAVDAEEPGRARSLLAWRLALLAALIVGWELAFRQLGQVYLAGPMQILVRIAEMARDGSLLSDTASTVRITAIGFVIGWTAGFALPALLRCSERATAAIEPYVMGSMTVPKFALIPLLILWFGVGATPKIVLVAAMTFYPIFISTFAGLRSLDRRLLDMALIAGAGPISLLRKVIWQSLLPFFFVGLKVSLPRALSSAIAGEFLVSDAGLGHAIENARQMADTVGVFAGIVVVVVLVLGLDALLRAAQARLLAWQPDRTELRW